jgi:hypothetical protein
MEHVLVIEKAMGKPLRVGAVPHHVNGNKSDNGNRNLVVCNDQAHHLLIHARARIVAAGGKPGIHKLCPSCGLRPLEEFHHNKRRIFGRELYCLNCRKRGGDNR